MGKQNKRSRTIVGAVQTPADNLPRGVSPDAVIRVPAAYRTHNPKRANSFAHKLFALMQKQDGKTVAEAAEAFRKSRLRMPKGYGLASELRHCVNKGFVELNERKALPAPAE